ncbi:MAG: hypothetical protein JRI57_10995 [Deltaproteobacteria bacterium]|nr:hypothetical protein [Deltaproteobacteria bacterium]
MAIKYIDYRVKPNPNVPQGMALTRLWVLSPIWQGSQLTIQYPEGDEEMLIGWSTALSGSPVDLQVFWTRHVEGAPAVCLAIGGDGGLRALSMPGAVRPESLKLPPGRGYALLGLAESLIPAAVLKVIGPTPEMTMRPEPLLLT